MSTTFVQPGDILTYAHTSSTTAGTAVLIGSTILGVPRNSAGANVANEYDITGVHTLPKLSTDVCAIGDLLYWDNGNSRLTKTSNSGANPLVGKCFKAAGNGATSVQVRLQP